jgi:hypothetical protein
VWCLARIRHRHETSMTLAGIEPTPWRAYTHHGPDHWAEPVLSCCLGFVARPPSRLVPSYATHNFVRGASRLVRVFETPRHPNSSRACIYLGFVCIMVVQAVAALPAGVTA